MNQTGTLRLMTQQLVDFLFTLKVCLLLSVVVVKWLTFFTWFSFMRHFEIQIFNRFGFVPHLLVQVLFLPSPAGVFRQPAWILFLFFWLCLSLEIYWRCDFHSIFDFVRQDGIATLFNKSFFLFLLLTNFFSIAFLRCGDFNP